MSEVLVAAFKFGFLALIWVFILICANVIRSDLFGHAVTATEPATPALKENRPKRRSRRNSEPRLLAVTQGRQRGLELPLTGEIRIGRAPDCTLLLDDDYSSSHHATVKPDPRGGWFVEDHGSTNGTYVNDTRITAPTSIGLDDDVRIGRTILKLVP